MVTVIVVGMPGSGKDVLVQTAGELGFNHVRMGDVVRDFARELGLDSSDLSIGGFANSEREKHGAEVWAVRTLDRMPSGDVLIDGSRSLAEIRHFKASLGDGLKVIGIEASAEHRFQRLKGRGRPDDPSTFDEFLRREERELSWGLGEALKNADVIIPNEEGLEEFRKRCRATLAKLLETDRKTI